MPRKSPKTSAQQKKLALLFLTLSLVYLVCELTLSLFLVQTDNWGSLTLSSQRWWNRYWKPINTLGFRDIEHSPQEIKNQKILFVVGDSFAAGHGIKKIEDRFSGILQNKLGNQWRVITLAKGGWSTPDQIKVLQQYPIKPDAILLSYFLNDIDQSAANHGVFQPPYIKRPAKILTPLLNHSSTFNFIYWRLIRIRHAELGEIQWAWTKSYFDHSEVWESHKKELETIIHIAEDKKVPLMVVIFPLLVDREGSLPITKKVAAVFQKHNVPVLDLTPEFIDRDYKELIVNPLDYHPNESTHKEVAEKIWPILKRLLPDPRFSRPAKA